MPMYETTVKTPKGEQKDRVYAENAQEDDYEDTEGFIIDICIDLPDDEPEVIYLFQENIREPPYINTCYIADCNGMNIMDCRAPNYIRGRGWVL